MDNENQGGAGIEQRDPLAAAPSFDTPDAYAPGPGQPPLPPPPPDESRGGGFPWLACCGVSCGLLLVLGGVAIYAGVKYFKPLVDAGVNLQAVAQEVQRDGVPDSGHIAVTLDELGSDPAKYDGQWVAFSGKVADDPDAAADAFQQRKGLEDSAAYFIEPNVVVLDVSSSQAKAREGDVISVVGKPIVLDFDKLLGPLTSGKIEKDSDLGDIQQLVFVITDEIKVDTAAAPAPDKPEDISHSEGEAEAP